MPCTPFTLPGGATGCLCTRTKQPQCACGRLSAYQCDALSSGHRSGTCDRHLCAQCATVVGPDRHLCSAHAGHATAAPVQAMLDL